jgi:hypothetical protein
MKQLKGGLSLQSRFFVFNAALNPVFLSSF